MAISQPAFAPRGIRHAVDHIKPLKAGSRGRDVLDALSPMVEWARASVGDRPTPDIELAERLGIGRANGRESLIAWQNLGIVTHNRKAGTILAAEVSEKAIRTSLTLNVEAASLLRTHAVRQPPEIWALRPAARHGSDAPSRVIMALIAELIAIDQAGEDGRDDAPFGEPGLGHATMHIQEGLAEAVANGREDMASTFMDRLEDDLRAVVMDAGHG